MKKGWVPRGLAAVCAAALAVTGMTGCGSSGDSAEATELNIMVWDEDYDESVFEAFEEKTGIHVNISYIDNTDTIITKLMQGSADYDLIDLESAYIKTFVDNGLLAEIDHDAIPNEQYIREEYYKGFTGDEDMKYTVPMVAPIYTCIIYNVETCPIEITEFADLADPALEGQVCMVNSTVSLFGMALEALGYDCGSTNEAEIAEAEELLAEIKVNVKAFVGESAVSALENGECCVAYCWDYMNLCNLSEDNWTQYAVAEVPGGAECSSPYIGIPASSTHKEEAQQLINFLLEPENYAVSTNAFGSEPILTQESLADYVDASFYENPAIQKNAELYEPSWKLAVDDAQITLLDTYYTRLMSQ